MKSRDENIKKDNWYEAELDVMRPKPEDEKH